MRVIDDRLSKPRAKRTCPHAIRPIHRVAERATVTRNVALVDDEGQEWTDGQLLRMVASCEVKARRRPTHCTVRRTDPGLACQFSSLPRAEKGTRQTWKHNCPDDR